MRAGNQECPADGDGPGADLQERAAAMHRPGADLQDRTAAMHRLPMQLRAQAGAMHGIRTNDPVCTANRLRVRANVPERDAASDGDGAASDGGATTMHGIRADASVSGGAMPGHGLHTAAGAGSAQLL